MDYKISPAETGDYIILTVRGTINRQTALQQDLEAHALGRELGIHRYLVDLIGEILSNPVDES